MKMNKVRGKAKHKCEICGIQFERKSDLTTHFKSVHKDSEPSGPKECEFCGLKFKYLKIAQ